MSQSLRHWILWHPGQLSSINTWAKTYMSIIRYPEIGDDVVVGTDNDAAGFISISMIFKIHVVAVDDDIISVDTLVFWKFYFVNNILHLQISFIVLMTSSFLLSIFSLMGIILLAPRFCTTTSIATVSLRDEGDESLPLVAFEETLPMNFEVCFVLSFRLFLIESYLLNRRLSENETSLKTDTHLPQKLFASMKIL